jgi:hypothetical protein
LDVVRYPLAIIRERYHNGGLTAFIVAFCESGTTSGDLS